MKKLIVLFLFFAVGLLSFCQTAKEDMMPITTTSKSALASYNEAMKCFDDVALTKARDLFIKSVKEDPNFFMANYELSLYYLWFGPLTKFKEYADAAIKCKTKLSPAEELIKSAIVKLKDKQNTDVTEVGKKLVEMYPKDPNSYANLFYFQSFMGDSVGVVETLNKAIKTSDNPAPFYNQLGYVYMRLKQNDKAEAAFNKYIELAPHNPNVYDSKGDYYMNVKEYGKAYETYMKAYALDTAWGLEKAKKAKQLSEVKEVK
jgi:tetratricopeptide (TPR) repeat protein